MPTRASRAFLIVVLVLSSIYVVPATAQTVSPCQSGTKASNALLQAARQHLALQQRSALKAADVVRVSSWQQLADAVEQQGDSAAPGWLVFELHQGSALVASSTVQLKPGMAVVAAGARHGRSASVRISCQEGVGSAFNVRLAAGPTARPASVGVLLQGLHISGCKGSAVLASGGLSAPQGVEWVSLPAGLHLVNTTLTGNAGAVGAAVRASRAALYLDSVQVSGNQASQLGGGISLEQGLLVALKTNFQDNTAGASGQMTTLADGVGAALYANSSTVVLANSTVAGNTGHNVGGCAIKADHAKGVVITGCTFDGNSCQGDGSVLVGGNYASATCTAGGASLMVQSNLTVPLLGNATQCELAPKHLVHISDSTFRRDSATRNSCGGSLMMSAAWLEVHRSSITGSGQTTAGIASALASTSSAVVLQDSLITGHRSLSHGGAVFHKRGRLWASGTTFSDSLVTLNDGGGCLYIIDATEIKVSGCVFDKCSAPGGGGAIFGQVMYDKLDFPPPMAIHASRFSYCSAGRDGGALNVLKMNLTVSDTVFEHNKGYYGAVLNTGGGPMTMTNTKFINNTATAGGQGGTIYAMDPRDSEFTDCTWLNNSAYQGAGIYASRYGGKADWTLTRCNFTGNIADQKGAAIYTTGMNYTFVGTTFSWNKALLGAGVYASSSGTSRPLNMLFSSCTLQHNRAEQSAGMAWLTGYAQAGFSNCSISNNHAGQSAGGLYLQDTPASLDGCVLAGNSARLAGAVMQQGSKSAVRVVHTRFVNNKAMQQAGAYLLMANSSLAMSSTSFVNNSASAAGGALAVLDGARLSCSSACNFTANSAALGGAIAVDAGAVNLTDAVLAGNSASQELVSVALGTQQQRAGSGGAVFATNSTVVLAKCSLQDNSAEAQGGALLLMSSAATLVNSRLTGNKAGAAAGTTAPAAAAQQLTTAGGAILVGLLPAALGAGTNRGKQVQVKLQDSVLSGNTAGYGGALAAVDAATDMQRAAAGSMAPGSAISIQLVGSSLVDNTATVSGGAVFSNLPSAALSLSGSKVSSNTAAQGGGGIAAVTPAAVQMAGSPVSGNSAAHCAGMLLDTPAQDSSVSSSRFEGNMAGQQVADARSFGQLPQWNSTGSGGGMCIIPGAAVSITTSTITQNSALHGAGMFVQDCVSRTGKSAAGQDAELLQDSRQQAPNSSQCRVSVCSRTVISGNKQQAGGSGSALYTTDTAAVAVAPDARAGRVTNSSTSIVTEAGPAAADSLAAKPSAVLGGFEEQRGRSSMAPVLLVDSGAKLPAVALRLVDQLGQALSPSLLQQLTFKAQAAATRADSRSDTNLLGVTSVVPSAANSSSSTHVSFDWLELQGAPGETLNVSFAVLEAPEVTPAVVQVQLKECTAGQAVQRGRQPHLYAGCTNCTNPLFSFDPSASQCGTCPPAGTYKVCSGGVVTPADGYWQSHPRSAQMLECPHPAACKPGAAADKLAAAGGSGQLLQQGGVEAYQELQCAPGYSGNLCSNCDRSSRVTQTLSHTCRSCGVSRAGSILLFILLRLFDLSVVLLSVFLVFKERQRRNMAVNGGLVSADSIREAMQQGTVVVPSTGPGNGPVEMKPAADVQGTDAVGNTGVDTYLTLFIEFMQLLSIFRLTRIGVVWRSAAEAVLLAMSITPISSYSWVSIECALREGLSPQQYAMASTLASTYIPVALVLATCAVVLMHVMRQARRLRYSLKDFPATVPGLLLATVKAVAYGYPMVVGSVLGLFSCKQLDSAAQVPGEVNMAQGNYWNRDLDTVCFQGTHLTYALAVGVPMLLLIVLYPLVQLLLLSRQARRQPDCLADVSFWANYSVLYQDYTQHMYLWGSVRDLRQLLLVAVVVVLQAYPVQLQMVGGWVLSLALLLSHVSLLPFRTRLLNGLQTAMLSAISFTFYTGVLSSIAGFPAKGSTALQYIAVVANLLVALVLLGVLIWRARLWLDFDKDGKVTLTDIKQTLQSGGEITGKAASIIAKRVASFSSTASRSFGRSSGKIKAGSVASSRSGALSNLNSQALDGFDSHILQSNQHSIGTLGSGQMSTTTLGSAQHSAGATVRFTLPSTSTDPVSLSTPDTRSGSA